MDSYILNGGASGHKIRIDIVIEAVNAARVRAPCHTNEFSKLPTT